MDESDWPFDQLRNCAVITLRPIVFDGAPILYVSHDANDHGWQFLGGDFDVAQAAMVCLSEIVKLDPSVLEIADLPPGWHAWRQSKESPWQRERDSKPSMTEDAFEGLIRMCTDELKSKQDALEREFAIGTRARWHVDAVAGSLTFLNDSGDVVVSADVTQIGTYSLKTQTWMWAWANESIPDHARTKAARLKGLFDVTGMHMFVDHHIDADEYLAWELAALSVHHLDSLGCYRGSHKHLWAFCSIDRVTRH